MATKLAIMNGALMTLGHRRLVDTGEPVEAGRELNAIYDQVLAECLSAGSWNFAMETIQADTDTGTIPVFGFAHVFGKPTDWLRTIGVSDDPYLSRPLLHYYDDMNFWSADVTPIYVRYVSNDTGLGLYLPRWPAAFARYAELGLASRVCLRITQNSAMLEHVDQMRAAARRVALNQDALNEPNPKFPPPNSWTLSRGGRGGGDRGSRGSLTG